MRVAHGPPARGPQRRRVGSARPRSEDVWPLSRSRPPGTKRAKKHRLRRPEHPGPRGARAGPQAARHVHRHHQRPRPASPRLRGRRQRDRRGDGRVLRSHRRSRCTPTVGERPGQRPRHPGQADPRRQGPPLGARGRPDRPARRRQVRRGRLRDLRRPARRRRLGGQRAVRAARRGGPPRRRDLHDGVRPRQGHEEAHEGQGRAEDRHADPVLARPRGLHRDGRVQEGDPAGAPARAQLPEQGVRDPARRRARRVQGDLQGQRRPRRLREVPRPGQGHPRTASSRSSTRATTARSRSRCSGPTPTASRSTPSPTRSTRTRAACTRRASRSPSRTCSTATRAPRVSSRRRKTT